MTNGGLFPQDLKITGVTADSRRVKPGYLFAAIPGVERDGRDFIEDAVAKGATAILTTHDVPAGRVGPKVSLIHDANPRRRYARMAGALAGRQPDTIIAVTGTNGKTSVADFTRQIWRQAGFDAASLGTLGLLRDGETPIAPAGPAMTTPDPADLHAMLADLAADGVRSVALEASSHGLDQYRLDGVRFSAAAFTNLSRDHLDYHSSMHSYRAAKLRLFEELLSPDAVIVVNTAAREHDQIANIAAEKKLRLQSYGLSHGALRCSRIHAHASGFELEIEAQGERFPLDFPLPGRFQIENALAAFGLATACGLDANRCAHALGALKGVRGRLERAIVLQNGAAVYVDYAHTPDALTTVLSALRTHTGSKLHVVFGCGGDRDPGKRPQMGAAATASADYVIVTDDNPRSEDPATIRKAAMAGAPGAKNIGDRKAAIFEAMSVLGPDDILCVAGKGHEQGQQVGETLHPFDDATIIRECAKELEGSA